MLKPKALNLGDCIGIISPSSPVKQKVFEEGLKYLYSLGFKVKVGKYALEKSQGFLAGSQEQRLDDLHQMFQDATIHAIFCSRGGHGSLSLLDQIDYDLIKRNPKIFLGYSDVTALHIAIGQKSGLITFHGPMVSDLIENAPEYNKCMLKRCIMHPNPIGKICQPKNSEGIQVIYSGTVTAKLTGGNLSLICSTLGTEFEMDCKKKILMIEEVGEPSYKIHRMLAQLALSGKLSQAAGFIIGEFHHCTEDEQYPLGAILKDVLIPYKKPTIYGVKCGHGEYKTTLPLGCIVTINGDTLIIEEKAVKY